MNWSRQANDAYYKVFLYSLDRREYTDMAAQTQNRLTVDVVKGRYVVGVLRVQKIPVQRNGGTSYRWNATWITYRTMNLDSGTTLQLP